MLFAALESILNRNIAGSSAARAACKRLAGKTLAVNFTGAPQSNLLSLHLHCSDERLSITSKSNSPAAATLSGTPLAFLSLVGKPAESALRSGNLRIEGDAEVAQAFRDLLMAARPDVEEELSRMMGDVAAHQLGSIARDALHFGRRAAHTFEQNVAEYLQEESRDVVTRIEVDEFVAAVDQLRDGVDRAQARLDGIGKTLRDRQ